MSDSHIFNVEIAKEFGVNEAIVLQNIHYWIEKNKANGKHFHDGRYWTYNSISAFEKLFPYWTGNQIRRILERLRAKKVLLTGNYNKSAYDRTIWYSIDYSVTPIWQNSQIKMTELPNQNDRIDEPIPDINTNENSDVKLHAQQTISPNNSLPDVTEENPVESSSPPQNTQKPPSPSLSKVPFYILKEGRSLNDTDVDAFYYSEELFKMYTDEEEEQLDRIIEEKQSELRNQGYILEYDWVVYVASVLQILEKYRAGQLPSVKEDGLVPFRTLCSFINRYDPKLCPKSRRELKICIAK